MSLKGMVMELLRADDRAGLEQLATSERRAMRYLLGRLWDPDEEIRQRAAVAIGAGARAFPDLGKDVIRRLLWDLNDESATNGVYGLAALGEIGYCDPRLIAPFIAPVASYAWDDGLRLEILRALCRVAESAPEQIAAAREIVERFGDMSNPEERPYIERLLTGKAEEGADEA
jgi:hypothetical protein